LHINSTRSGILQAAIGIGIGLGSFAAGSLSGGKIEYGLVPLGAAGMTAFGFLLSLQNLSFNTILALLALLGFSGGFFIVPINALSQHRPDERDKGGVIASANLLLSPGSRLPAVFPNFSFSNFTKAPREFFCGLRWGHCSRPHT